MVLAVSYTFRTDQMPPPNKTCLVLTVLLFVTCQAASYKILIFPFSIRFNSRLLNMQKMADILAEDGHQVDVIMNDKVKDHVITKHAKTLYYQAPKDVIDYLGEENAMISLNQEGMKVFTLMDNLFSYQIEFCTSLFKDKNLMQELQGAKYDLVIADILFLCSPILPSYLNVTSIFYQNYGFLPDSNALFPTFPSFTCHATGVACVNDDMTFMQRCFNVLFVLVINQLIVPKVSKIRQKMITESGIELAESPETLLQDKLLLLNVDYVLEAPRPTMPHVFTISGLFNKRPSDLPATFERIIDQAGQHGVILFSFGTLVPKYEARTAEIFANVFGRLKQQIIWRYTGDKPKGLQNNTHLTEWFPQNDLLAHASTRLFITHCGISSTFESAYNGVPVVAMPLFGDQSTNAEKLVGRAKMGIKLNYFSITEEELAAGIEEVLFNPVYMENAKKVSRIMSDQVAPPVQQFRHLVNFTIKTGDAKHLFHPYAVRMSWFTFHGLDVGLFILSVFLAIVLMLFLMFRIIIRRCWKIVCIVPKMKKN